MRRVIAERLAHSKREAPHFYMSLDCRAEALLDLKRTLSDRSPISLNDLILKITATALKRVPALNAAWSDAGIRNFRSVDLAVAVAIEGGLITPVIRGADTQARHRDRRGDARPRGPAPDRASSHGRSTTGGTFTVSNMGMYGVDRFTAVINPPQAADPRRRRGDRTAPGPGRRGDLGHDHDLQPVGGPPGHRRRRRRRVHPDLQTAGGGSTPAAPLKRVSGSLISSSPIFDNEPAF